MNWDVHGFPFFFTISKKNSNPKIWWNLMKSDEIWWKFMMASNFIRFHQILDFEFLYWKKNPLEYFSVWKVSNLFSKVFPKSLLLSSYYWLQIQSWTGYKTNTTSTQQMNQQSFYFGSRFNLEQAWKKQTINQEYYNKHNRKKKQHQHITTRPQQAIFFKQSNQFPHTDFFRTHPPLKKDMAPKKVWKLQQKALNRVPKCKSLKKGQKFESLKKGQATNSTKKILWKKVAQT